MNKKKTETKTTVPAKKPAAPKPKATTTAAKPKTAATKTTASKKPVARTVAPKGKSIAVFVDLDNAGASLLNLEEIMSILVNTWDISYGKLYGYTDDRAEEFDEMVREYKFDTAGRLRFKFDNISTVDLRLVLDSIIVCQKNKFDAVFIWGGNGDFIPLFAYLADMGLKIIVPDVPSFDCKNKFVSQSITLYSAHTVGAARARVMPHGNVPVMGQNVAMGRIMPSEVGLDTTVNMQDMAFDSEPVPIVPRKRGAPGSGREEEKLPEEDDEPITDEEYRRYLLEQAREALRATESGSESSDGLADLGAISAVSDGDLPEDGDPFVKELMEIGEFNKEEQDPLTGETVEENFTPVGDDFGSLNR